jgi:pimeloyl-ACP methyl ester carboxylesterase
MQQAITCTVDGKVLRGMEHFPDGDRLPVPAVLLFHGFTANKLQEHRLFLKISRALCERGVAAIRFDFSGSGESDGDFEEMTVSGELREAHALLDRVLADGRVDATRVSVLGLSMGGLVGGILAGERPADVHRLVLLAAAGNMRELIARGVGEAPERRGDILYDAGGNLVGWSFYDDLMTIDGFSRAAPYSGPVLLVHGTNDESVSYEVAYRYRDEAYRGKAEVILVEEADHTFNRHDWELQVLTAVTEFLTKV